jgi:CheY-like chemotaxis protein
LANLSHEQRERAIESGFDKHIAKPVQPTQLALIIADLIAKNNV